MHYHSVSITSVQTLPMAVLNGLHVFEKTFRLITVKGKNYKTYQPYGEFLLNWNCLI